MPDCAAFAAFLQALCSPHACDPSVGVHAIWQRLVIEARGQRNGVERPRLAAIDLSP